MKNIPLRTGEKSGIYQIKNCTTGKFYVGSSKNIYYRIRRHLSDLRKGKHANPILTNAFNKYGEDDFEAIILEEVSIVDLLKREEYWINFLKPNYNVLGLKIQRPVVTSSMRRKISRSVKAAHKAGLLNSNRKAVDAFDLLGNKIGNYVSMRVASKVLGVSWDSIHRVLVGKHQQNKGYIFRYAKDNIAVVSYFKRPRDMSKLNKPIIVANVITSEIFTLNSLLELKAVFGSSVVHNVSKGILYKDTYLFQYAT